MIDPSNTIRAAYYSALNNTIAFGTGFVPFYTQADSGATYPYIIATDFTCKENRNKDQFGWELTMTIKIVSLYKGDYGGQDDNDGIANSAMGIIVGSKPGQNPLSFAPNFVNIVSGVDSSQVIAPENAPDGQVFSRVIKFRHLISQYNS